MNRAEEFKHYITDPQTKVVICSADLAPHRRRSANAALPEAQRAARTCCVTRYTDAMPEGPIDAGRRAAAGDGRLAAQRPAAAGRLHALDRRARAQAACPARTPRSPTTWRCCPTPRARPALPKGCMHTHRTLMHNAVGGGSGATPAPETVEPRRRADVPHHRHALRRARLGLRRHAPCVLMPRWDRELAGPADLAATGVTHWTCIPTMVIDLFGSPNYKSFDLSSLRYISGGGAAMPHAVAAAAAATSSASPSPRATASPRPRRRATPTRPSAPSCSAWASRSSASTRASSTRSR